MFPPALFVDTNNSIYVVNKFKNQVLIWNDGQINPTEITEGNFSDSWSIFVTNSGDIFIENSETNRRVDKWDKNTRTFINIMNVDSACWGLFVDMNDTLYCSMHDNHKVVKIWLNDSNTTSTIAAGTSTEGSASNELNGPSGIFVDVNFDLYVADSKNHRIQLFQFEQKTGTTIAGEGAPNTILLSSPSGIVLDIDKNIFIVDFENHRIVIGSGSNGFRCLVGCQGLGSQSNQLTGPFTLSFDKYGNMFVSDVYNHRIQKFDLLINICGKLMIIQQKIFHFLNLILYRTDH
uniref:NHL repeat containing-like protein n=1 Tax=Adineta vaga TaxID=104782 RepID=B3G4M9_ADIVA|nr:NHL repeat containing-like protein [Adineta vaga]